MTRWKEIFSPNIFRQARDEIGENPLNDEALLSIVGRGDKETARMNPRWVYRQPVNSCSG
jgi:hypothetical protein